MCAPSLASHAVHPVTFAPTAVDGAARTGVATTARGAYTTPCFMPVGTRGAVKYLSAEDYERLGVQIVLGNTYHLMLRPGADVIARFGGLGRFSGWDGLTLTDSGGYQVFSLEPQRRRRRGDVPQHLRRIDPPPHAGRRRARPGADRRRHPDGPRRLPAAAEPT